jgi:hypothetical protein
MAKEHADEERFSNSETALGGADSVQKTTGLTGGSGSDPDRNQDRPIIAQVPSGGGVNLGAWVVGGIALLIGVIYAAGIFR